MFQYLFQLQKADPSLPRRAERKHNAAGRDRLQRRAQSGLEQFAEAGALRGGGFCRRTREATAV
jgi:hypothetical protein